ncbi:MAG TPA: hypothetical protein VIF64_19300 [Pyrinomonadaceae bacterium]|jgi:hypothetical protein
MTLADSILNQLKLAESLRAPRRPESAEPVNTDFAAKACRYRLDQVVKRIDPPKVRRIVQAVFSDLLRLLDYLRPLESQLYKVDEAEKTFALFQFIHDEASALVKSITEDALTCEALSEDLFDTLDGMTFAVSHDLQRVFETKLPGAIEENTGRVIVGKLFRAHDVLTNCLQQATISLATLFDPELGGTKLFGNSDMLYRQALELCADLSKLLKLVEEYSERGTEPAFASLTAGIEKFRLESMDRLRYSDCPQFEGFCERIQLAATQDELDQVLHEFRCYVETLLGQVKMRAVLANVFPIDFETGDLEQLPSPAQYGSSQSYSADDFEDDSVTPDRLLIAV